MALTNYTELKSAVADWLERADLSARIPDFISLAEAQMNRALRVRRMVVQDTNTVSTAYFAVPNDYLDAITLATTLGTELDPAPSDVLARFDTSPAETGPPRFYALVGDQFQVFPAPDQAYTFLLTYYGRVPALSADNPANWILTESPDAYLYGTLLQAAPYLRDAEATEIWSGLYGAAMTAIQASTRTRAGKLRTEIPSLNRATAGFHMMTGR